MTYTGTAVSKCSVLGGIHVPVDVVALAGLFPSLLECYGVETFVFVPVFRWGANKQGDS